MNKKIIFICTGFFFIISCIVLFNAKANNAEILKKITEVAKNINSYEVDYVLEIKQEGELVKSIGHIKFQEPNMFFMKLELPEMEGFSQIFVSDGNTMWQYLPYMQLATKIDLKKIEETEAGQEYLDSKADIRNPFQDIKKDTINVVGQEEDNGDIIYIIEGQATDSLREESIAEISKTKIWISLSKGIPKKIIWYDDIGNVVIEQDFMNIKTNQEIDKEEFIFSPPQGTEVIDITYDLELE